MKYVLRKMDYYITWYAAMSESEQQTLIGLWVRERIDIYASVLVSQKKAA